MMVQAQEEMGEGSANSTDPYHTPTIIQPSTYPQKQRLRKTKRKDTELPQTSGPTNNVADKAVDEEINDSLVRAATTASSLEAEQDSSNINKTQSKATPNEVLDLETTKTTKAMEIESLKRKVKKLEKKQRSRTYKLKRLYKGRIVDIDANKYIYLVNVHTDEDMFGANDLDEVPLKEVSAVDEVNVVSSATTTTAIIDDITLAKALMEIKSAKPKTTAASTRPMAKRLVIHQHKIVYATFGEKKKVLCCKESRRKEEQTTNTSSTKKIMCTYLKNMEGKKLIDLKNKSFDSIQKMFDIAFKRVNTYFDYKTKLVEESSKKAKAEVTEGSSKRAGEELEQENAKKKKIEDDKESTELK
nr:hypothetical protein [Tanacetum cinerariifolium]